MASKRILTSKLTPGMTLSSDVVTSIGQVLLLKGAVLSDSDITRLEFYSIMSVNVETDDPVTASEFPYTDAPSYLEKIKERPEFQAYKISFAKTHRNFEETMLEAVQEGAVLDPKELLHMIDDLVASAKNISGVFDMLHNLRTYDDQIYAHSINVALICSAMADWFKLSPNDRQTLILSGLLMDIGKIKIDKNLLNKKDLTKAELKILHNHTTEGYNLILQQTGVNEHVRNAVLMHHERLDGSGYPLGIQGDQIDEFAKMVAIADVYEAMTAPRVYRKAFNPFEVIRIFEEEGKSLYDPKYLPVFLENVLNTYLQNKVLLSNGEEGMIVMINKNYLSRPLIRTQSAVYDLRKRRDLEVLEIR